MCCRTATVVAGCTRPLGEMPGSKRSTHIEDFTRVRHLLVNHHVLQRADALHTNLDHVTRDHRPDTLRSPCAQKFVADEYCLLGQAGMTAVSKRSAARWVPHCLIRRHAHDNFVPRRRFSTAAPEAAARRPQARAEASVCL